ncbi:MAG: hypothetical protein V8Q41_00795 [Anaerostipes hadrus]
MIKLIIDLPNGIVFKDEIFAPCEILDGSWTPYGNTGYVNGQKRENNCAMQR